tara:strand:+ start:2465 stop:4237 length:1773 start_codon:yes stop_codon:yes gene_type:complete
MDMQHNHTPVDTGSFFGNLFQDYVPRQQCMFYEGELIALHAVSDFLIAAAYFSIPIALVYLVRKRRDLTFNGMFLLFALFIVLCGLTHIFGIVSLWHAYYRADGIIKLITGLVSIATAIVLWRMIPKIMALPSIDSIISNRDELERMVKRRTRELTQTNDALRESEQKYKHAAEAAEIANQAKSDFLANMSHELRTPLGVVTGITQIMYHRDDIPDEVVELMDIQMQSASSLETIIGDLLDIDRIQSQKIELEVFRFDMAALVHGVVNSFSGQAARKGVDLSIADADALPPLRGDPGRIRQILNNLVANALKFTQEGTIHLTVQKLSQKNGICTFEVRVADTGVGIPLDKQEHIFERFNQADNSITRMYGGTGLGLAISRELARIMNGDVTVQSEEGKGSTFTVLLRLAVSDDADVNEPELYKKRAKPIGSGTPEPSKPASPEAPSAQSSISAKQIQGLDKRCRPVVLTVDDQLHNRDMIGRMLRLLGCEVITATQGLQALDIIKDRHAEIDCVLMDVQMYDLDGIEATNRVRAWEAEEDLEALPIVALTANAQPEVRQQCDNAGMNDFIAKPFHMQILREKLQTFIALK